MTKMHSEIPRGMRGLRGLGYTAIAVVLIGTSVAAWIHIYGNPELTVVSAATGTKSAADLIGERLFMDSRFSQYFAVHMTGINTPLKAGDPVVNAVQTTNGTLPGPFAGQAMNCRSCHFGNEFEGITRGGMRTNADFATHSPIPLVMNGFSSTPRNSMQLADVVKPNGAQFLHFDGEFATGEDLVLGSFTGRNFGWTPSQSQQALSQMVAVIRGDDGTTALAKSRTDGFSYTALMLGTNSNIPASLKLPLALRLDVTKATAAQIETEVATLVTTYMQDLLFRRDASGNFNGSPYDAFLKANSLPQLPNAGETRQAYGQRLLSLVLALKKPVFITPANGSFLYHNQPWQFGATELAGLEIFLRTAAPGAGNNQHAANCASCHQPPDFADPVFHNTGVTQEEYDNIHGQGAFENLAIPNLATRNANYNQYLPATSNHPSASESFRRPASASNPKYADLGLWNIYLNSDFPTPQANLAGFVCAAGKNCSVDQGLETTIAQFRTPSLRDLADSDPYFHNGSKRNLGEVIQFYLNSARLSQNGQLRNGAPEFKGMVFAPQDAASLEAFMVSLTEDYNDN